MNTNPFETINFQQQRRIRLSPRSLWIIAVGAIYLLAGWMLPFGVFFWLIFAFTLINAWAASFGWREAIRQLSIFIQRLEQL